MKVKSVVEHRYNGEPKKVGDRYELPKEIAEQKIAEGWIEAVEEKKK